MATNSEGVKLIAEERERQQTVEGWTTGHDYQHHKDGQLVKAAIAYAAKAIGITVREAIVGKLEHVFRDLWPWDKSWDKRAKHSPLRLLVIAGALIAAEIDWRRTYYGEQGYEPGLTADQWAINRVRELGFKVYAEETVDEQQERALPRRLEVEVEVPSNMVQLSDDPRKPPKLKRPVNVRLVGSQYTEYLHHDDDFVWVRVAVRGIEEKAHFDPDDRPFKLRPGVPDTGDTE